MKFMNKPKAQAIKIVATIVLMLTPSLCFAQANAHMLSGVNAQIGISYTMQAADQIKLTTFNNPNPVAVTLPAATTPNFGAGTLFSVRNLGAGLVTITTPPGTLIDNGPNLLLTQGQGADIYSDGTNYISQKGAGTAQLTGMTAAQVPIAATATTVASSKAIQGAADTGILGAGTISGVSSPICTDANGGATTVGCPSGGGSPAGSDFQAQVHNGAAFGATPCFNVSVPASLSALANLDCDSHHIGPNPSADITRYGARFTVNPPTAANAVCVSGSNSVTVGTVSGDPFQVGDYVLIFGCGPTVSAATPAAPTVISGATQTQTVPDAIINAYTGTSSYSYLLVTKDSNGGLTIPSTATTISNGVPIGQQTATVISVVSAGQTMTINLGSAGPPNNTLFHLSYIASGGAQPNHKFDGYWNVCSGGGTTTITVCNMPYFSNVTDSTAAEIIWFNGNQVSWTNQANAWTQYICGKRPGDVSFHFLGSAVPSTGGGAGFTKWTDWGTTLTPSSPTGFPEGGDSICTAVSSAPDYLDNVKITACTASCGTGSTWTLSGNASQNRTSTALHDDAAALAAAATANAGLGAELAIPCPTNINSRLQFLSPQAISGIKNWISECGNVNMQETMDLGNVNDTYSVPWICKGPQMLSAHPCIMFVQAYPGLNNTGIIRNMQFNDQTSSGTVAVIENTNQVSNGAATIMMDHNAFTGPISGIGIMTLGIFPFGYLTNTEHNFGPANSPSNYDATWTPWLYAWGGGELYIRNTYGFGRGIYINNFNTAGPTLFDINQYYIQGSIMPMIGYYGAQGTSGSLNLFGTVSDTSPQTVIAVETQPNSPLSNIILRVRDTTGLPVLLNSGWVPTQLYDEFSYAGQSGFPPIAATLPDLSTNFGRVALQTSTRNDNFNRGSLGSSWTQILNTISISGNQIIGNTAGWDAAYDLGSTPLPNVSVPLGVGSEFCDITIVSYGGSTNRSGCSVLGTAAIGYACTSSGTQIFIEIPNSSILAGGTNYSGGGVGDRLYGVATVTAGAANTAISCTVYPINGAPVTITASDPSYNKGYPGVATTINNSPSAIMDNFSGGTINPILYPTVENSYQSPQHYLSGTVGNSAPIPGALPTGYWSAGTIQSLGWSAADGPNSAYDGFNRANGGLGANWATLTGTTAPTITSNQVLGNTAATLQGAIYTASTFSADQFAQITAPVGGSNAGAIVDTTCRNSTTAQTFYAFGFFNGNFNIVRVLATVSTTLSTAVGTLLSGDALRIECVGTTITGFQISGGVKTQILQSTDGNIAGGNPGFAVYGNVAQSVADNWSGGNVNTLSQPTVEEDVLGNRHFMNAITVGLTAPVAGALGPGIYNTLWTPSSSICTDTNSKLVTTGCAGGSISGMTAGQLAVAGSASSITSSKAIQGTDSNILSSSTVAAAAGNSFCTDTGGGATTTGCPTLSGLTTGQVPIAGSATTVTSSKAQQGTDTSILTSGTVSGTGATLCTDANGGATTVGCTGGSISGLTAGGVAIAGTATTITSSKPQQGTDANILTSGTISATTPALLCTDANSGATTANCSVYNTQSAATNTNITAANMVASAPANTMYMYMWTISLTTVGTGCTSTTSVVLNVIFTDPSAAGSITESLGQISIAPGGNGTLGFVAQGVDNIYAKSGTAVQYSTSGYTPGTGCTVNPSYQVTMRLLPIS